MSEDNIREADGGTIIVVRVRPNSKEKHLITDTNETEIVINLKSPAREGRANRELIKRLSKVLGVPSAAISIVAGGKSKVKTLHIRGLSPREVSERLLVPQKSWRNNKV